MGAAPDTLAEAAEFVGVRCGPCFGVLRVFTQLSVFEDGAGVGIKDGEGGVEGFSFRPVVVIWRSIRHETFWFFTGLHPWSWGRVRVKVGDGCWVRGLVGHLWRSMRGEGDGVGDLRSVGVCVEDAMASIMFQGCAEVPTFLATVIP